MASLNDIFAGREFSAEQARRRRRLALMAMAQPFPGVAGGVDDDGPAVSLDFVNGQYAGGATAADLLSVTRNLTSYAQTTGDLWVPFSANTLRITNRGLLVEGSRTNSARWNRDLTNAVWTKSNMTAAKDQSGIDAVASSASRITASANNATILQAITSASAARWTTAFVKRITGIGVLQMTVDNGSTWTTLDITNCANGDLTPTAVNASAFVRASIPTQTLANPTVGFRIGTSGDEFAIDGVQVENSSAFASSPILTTTAAVNRPAENIGFNNINLMSLARGTWIAEWGPRFVSGNLTSEVIWMRVGAGNVLGIEIQNGTVQGLSFVASNFEAQLQSQNAVDQPSVYRALFAYEANNFAAAFSPSLGTTPAPDTSGAVPTGLTGIFVGNSNGGSHLWGYVRKIAGYRSWLPAATHAGFVA